MKVLDLYCKIMQRLGDDANDCTITRKGCSETHMYDHDGFTLVLSQYGTTFDVAVVQTARKHEAAPPRIRFCMRLDGEYAGNYCAGVDIDRTQEFPQRFITTIPPMQPYQKNSLLPFDTIACAVVTLIDAFLHDETSKKQKKTFRQKLDELEMTVEND